MSSEVTILDSDDLDPGESYTAAAGSNRALVYVAGARGGNESEHDLTSLEFGGVSMTQAVLRFGGNTRRIALIYYLLEAQIPSGSQMLVATWGTSPSAELKGHIYTLGGVDQSEPVHQVTAADGDSDPSGTLTAEDELEVLEGDLTLTAITWRNDRTPTIAAGPGFSTDRTTFADGHTRGTAHREESSDDEYTPSWTHSTDAGSFEQNRAGAWAVFASAEPEEPDTSHAEISWAEFEAPSPQPQNRLEVSWTEFEAPSPPSQNRLEISWAEMFITDQSWIPEESISPEWLDEDSVSGTWSKEI